MVLIYTYKPLMHIGIYFGVCVASWESSEESITSLSVKFLLNIKDVYTLGHTWGLNTLLHLLPILVDHRILIVYH